MSYGAHGRVTSIWEVVPRTPAVPSSPLKRLRDQLIRSGFWFSTTRASRLFDRLPTQHRIAITGLDDSGKSTLLRKHLSQDWGGSDIVKYVPWIGMLIEEVNYGNVVFYAQDLGGCRKSKKAETNLFTDADAVIWTLDSSDLDRMAEAEEELRQVVFGPGGFGAKKPVLLLANRQDLPRALKIDAIKQRCAAVLGDRPWHIVGTTITTGEGVLAGLRWLSEQLQAKPVKEKTDKVVMSSDPQSSEKV
ncbi:putative ADP-ribosylation factor [Seiridium cardinale]|uniref:ADP-ribosylation factor n=1 Tax=Seiridium cardinale TaxID=138064 RepID=A0ABR2XXM3_9PEZI